MEDGFIKLSRKFADWEWYTDKNTKILFLHLLLNANWKDGRFKGRIIPKGSLVTSIKKLSLGADLTEREVRTALSHLVETGEIDKQTTSKFTVITINKWDEYQSSDKVKSGKRHSNDIQMTTIEEGKKERREEYIVVSKDTTCSTPSKKEVERIAASWNTLSDLGIKPVTKLTPGTRRYKNLCARMKQYSPEDVLGAIEKIKNSDFLLGRKKDFTITFDWFVKPNNFPKVFEGNYDNNDSGGDTARKEIPAWRKEWIEEHDSVGT